MSGRVIVSGIGVVSPLGGRETFRDRLLAGSSGVAPITAFDVSACRTRFGATVTEFDPAQWIAPMKSRRMDDTARYAVVITRQTLEDAGAMPAPEGDDGVGVVLGTFTAGGQATSEYLTALHRGGPTGAPALLFNSTVGNAPASLAGLEFKLRGPNVTVSQKEASSLGAVVVATDALRLGRATALVSGGVDAIFDIFFRVHDRFGVMATSIDPPGPFDRRGEGFVLGEGGYAVLLERDEGQGDSRETGARQRGYGEIIGVAAGSANAGLNEWPADPASLVRTIRDALADAEVAPADVAVVYAAANGAPTLDAIEAEALTIVFGEPGPLVTSIKGAVGESGASGAASLAAALLCGRAGAVPPIARLTHPLPSAAGLRLVHQRTNLEGGIALVNGIASGGSLFAVVLRVWSSP